MGARAARKARRAAGEGGHSHHLVERQLGRGASWRQKLKGDGPAVNVPDANFHLSHMRIAINKAYADAGVAGNLKEVTREQVEDIIKKIYKDAPRLRNKALKWLKGQ